MHSKGKNKEVEKYLEEQCTEQEKIIKLISDKGLISKMYKYHKQGNKNKENDLIQKWAQGLSNIFLKT